MSNLNLSNDDIKRLGDFFGASEEKNNNNYYVYALCNDGVPFYVGKGIGTRCLNHEEDMKKALESALDEALESALKEYDNEMKEMDEDEKALFEEKLKDKLTKELTEELTNKLNEIRIAREKNTFNIIIVKFGLTEPEAFMVESAVINALSFCGIKLTNAVNGHSSKKEKETGEPTKARYLDEFLKDCCPPVVSLTEIDKFLESSGSFNKAKDEVTFINYNACYPYCKTDIDIWDAVRGCWRMSEKKAKKTKYVFAMHHNIIKGIFKVKNDGEKYTDFQKIHSATVNLKLIKGSNIEFKTKGDMETIEQVINLIRENPSLKGKAEKLAEITGKESKVYYRAFFACDIKNFESDEDLKLLREKFLNSAIPSTQLKMPQMGCKYFSVALNELEKLSKS